MPWQLWATLERGYAILFELNEKDLSMTTHDTLVNHPQVELKYVFELGNRQFGLTGLTQGKELALGDSAVDGETIRSVWILRCLD